MLSIDFVKVFKLDLKHDFPKGLLRVAWLIETISNRSS